MGNRWDESDIRTDSYKFVEKKHDGSLGWVPSVGQSIDFLIGRTEKGNGDGGITKYTQTSKTYKISLDLPDIDMQHQEGVKNVDKFTILEGTVENLLTKTDFLDELEKLCDGGSNLIGANSGQYWGDDPVRCLGDALKNEGYLIAEQPVYSKIGGRNRYQTYGTLISGKKGHSKFNYESKSTTNYPFFLVRI